MCFSPQRREIFRHQTFKKWSRTLSFLTCSLGNVPSRHNGVQFFDIASTKNASEPRCLVRFDWPMCFAPQRRTIFDIGTTKSGLFCTFWLTNVLLATATCNFSTSELQKVLRRWGALYIFTSKCAFRDSTVQFLISPRTTWLRTRRFNRPTFRLTRHTNHWKNTAFRDFSNMWRGCIFFLLTFLRYGIFFLLTWLLHSAFQLSILSEVRLLNFLRSLMEKLLNPRISFSKPAHEYVFVWNTHIYIYINIWIMSYRMPSANNAKYLSS